MARQTVGWTCLCIHPSVYGIFLSYFLSYFPSYFLSYFLSFPLSLFLSFFLSYRSEEQRDGHTKSFRYRTLKQTIASSCLQRKSLSYLRTFPLHTYKMSVCLYQEICPSRHVNSVINSTNIVKRKLLPFVSNTILGNG